MSKIEVKKFAVVRNFGKSDEFFKFFNTEVNAMKDLKKIADSYLNNPITWLNDKSFSAQVGGNSIDIWEIREIHEEKEISNLTISEINKELKEMKKRQKFLLNEKRKLQNFNKPYKKETKKETKIEDPYEHVCFHFTF